MRGMPEERPVPVDPLRAALEVRDREEAERLRQLGGLLVHDLNNVLFALLGRLQLLERRAADPSTAKAARELLETTRVLESQIVRLHAACRRDEPAMRRSGARAAFSRALAEARATLPADIRPADIESLAAVLPADLTFEGDLEQVCTAVRQLLSIHRARADAPLRASLQLVPGESAHRAEAEIEFRIEDDAGPPPSAPAIPSLLADGFSLEGLPLAAAVRATRDFGGTVRCEPTTHGLRSTLRFAVERGLPLASFDARGAEHAADRSGEDSCGHADECLPPSRRVLIADDDPAVRAVLIAALESIGDDVDAIGEPGACDAHPGLEAFDVVILDAGGGGLAALARLRARGVAVPVLVASGEVVELAGDPRTRCALKPIPLDTLDRELASLARLGQRA